MAHATDDFTKPGRHEPTVARLVRKITGWAALLAVPAIWIAMRDGLPEARIMGLAIIIMLIGVAGLCLLGRR